MWFQKKQTDNKSSNTSPGVKTPLAIILDFVELIVVSVAIVIPIRYFLIQPFSVKGMSMEPNFYENEYLIVDEISYRFREPQRGEVVVIRNPQNTKQYLLKRIIGLPNETLKLQPTKILINVDKDGKELVLDESKYLTEQFIVSNDQLLELKYDEFYVLGDNRDESLDSRFFGPVKRNHIVGRVWVRVLPFDRFMINQGVSE